MSDTGSPYSPAEDAFIVKAYKTVQAKDIATALNRPRYSVQNRIRFLGLTKSGKRKKAQLKKSVFLEPALEATVGKLAKKAGLSDSAFIQECVRTVVQKEKHHDGV